MKHILLVIDVQRGFMVDGVTDRAKTMIDDLLKLEIFDSVISTVYQNYPGSPLIQFMGWEHLLTEESQAVIGEAAHRSHHFVTKQGYSGCTPELMELLKQENDGTLPEAVFVVGFDTECCVLMTATDLFEAGIRPIVLTQYCGASGGADAHHAGLRALKSLIGSNNMCADTIRTREDLLQAQLASENTLHISSVPSYQKAVAIVEQLMEKKWHISFAESCTGGMAAAGIVDVASASAVFNESFVTYANSAKVDYLGVSPDTIAQYGVVSEPVALEMAQGVAKAAKVEVGVGISGIAGPSGGTATKPVGMVCFGFWINGEHFAKTVHFGNIGRNNVRQASVDFVYTTLLEHLN